MKAYVGVTDLDWYLQLSSRALEHDEVNFWLPSPRQGFRAIATGAPFIFKTHVDRRRPDLSNRLVGVGLYSGFARVRLSEAWEWFGSENGVRDEDELRRRIEHYRRQPIGLFEDPEIGAVLLNDVVFFPRDNNLAAPDNFARSVVRGRTYSMVDLDGAHSAIEAVLRHRSATLTDLMTSLISPETRGHPTLMVPRIGQQAFKAVIADRYRHHCAITGAKVRPALQAAHIRPVEHGGQHRVDNGLLLRSDVHTLFDRGYIGVDEKYRLRVSPALREEFGNGDWSTPGRARRSRCRIGARIDPTGSSSHGTTRACSVRGRRNSDAFRSGGDAPADLRGRGCRREPTQPRVAHP